MNTHTILQQCEERIGYRFKDKDLLQEALTHSSGAETRMNSNERLEFLGDAILGFVICEVLFRRFPDLREGDMTKIKSAVVSRASCREIGKRLKMDELLIVGRGVQQGGRISFSMLANVVESIIAALYLDGGLKTAQKFIRKEFESLIEQYADSLEVDNFKSLLQQIAQRDFGKTPEYKVLEISGPEHSKCFRVGVKIEDTTFQSAWGNNKKEAEQRAAENALYMLRGEEAPYFCGE